MGILQTGNVDLQSDGTHARVDAVDVTVPARLTKAGVKLHQDRYGNGMVVNGLVAVVYLAGNGNMTFVHADSQEEHSCFKIMPGCLIMWNNTNLMHKVDVGDDAKFRVILGAMSLDPASLGGVVVEVGLGGVRCVRARGLYACVYVIVLNRLHIMYI